MSTSSRTDVELIKAFVVESDKAAFDLLLRRHYAHVFRVANRMLHNEDDAHDVCQSVWLKLLEVLPNNYKEQDNFIGFLTTLTKHIVLDRVRSLGYRTDREEIDHQAKEVVFERDESSIGAIQELFESIVPAMRCKYRLVFLLKHESELWDKSSPLGDTHIAYMNGWSLYQYEAYLTIALKKIKRERIPEKYLESMTCEEKIAYFMRETSRLREKPLREDRELAEMIGMSPNTFKTRYRRALDMIKPKLAHWV